MKDLFELLNAYLDFSIPENYFDEDIAVEGLIASEIEFLSAKFDLNTIDKFDIAILGVQEERNSKNKGCALSPNLIRAELYKLSITHRSIKLIDLGNLKSGKTVRDTYYALQEVLKELIPHNIVFVIIGGSQDLTYAQYMAYEGIDKIVNIASIDSRFDFGDSDKEINSDNFLSKIVIEKGNHLFNYSNLGFQTYHVPLQDINLMDELYFDSVRLGELQTNIKEAEYHLRDCDMVSFDISAVRQGDAPGCLHVSPNGLFGNEACQLARYAGISEKVTSIGLYEVNPNFDNRNQTIALSAQIIWHFIDGFYNRQNEQPDENIGEFERYSVAVMEHNIIFVHSIKTNRWWLEVPYPGNDLDMVKTVSCSLSDYKLACDGEIPDRWWKTFQKIS